MEGKWIWFKKDSYKKFGKEIGKEGWIWFKKIGFLKRLGFKTWVDDWAKKLICFKKSGFTNLLEKELGKGVEFDSKELPFRGFWEKTMEKKVELNSKKEVFAKIISCET